MVHYCSFFSFNCWICESGLVLPIYIYIFLLYFTSSTSVHLTFRSPFLSPIPHSPPSLSCFTLTHKIINSVAFWARFSIMWHFSCYFSTAINRGSSFGIGPSALLTAILKYISTYFFFVLKVYQMLVVWKLCLCSRHLLFSNTRCFFHPFVITLARHLPFSNTRCFFHPFVVTLAFNVLLSPDWSFLPLSLTAGEVDFTSLLLPFLMLFTYLIICITNVFCSRSWSMSHSLTLELRFVHVIYKSMPHKWSALFP